MEKKAQLSYEYLLVIGMVLVLIIPFYAAFIGPGVTTTLNTQSNQDVMTIVAQAVETVTNLGGGTTSMEVVVEPKGVASSTMTGTNRMVITTTTGQTYSSTVSANTRVYGSLNALTGSGTQTVTVARPPDNGAVTVSTQSQPVITKLCANTVPVSQLASAQAGCTTNPAIPLKVTPSGTFYVVGSNLGQTGEQFSTVVGLTKQSGGQGGGGQGIFFLFAALAIGPIPCTQDNQCSGGNFCTSNNVCTEISLPAQKIPGQPAGTERNIIRVPTGATGTGMHTAVINVPGIPNAKTIEWAIQVTPIG